MHLFSTSQKQAAAICAVLALTLACPVTTHKHIAAFAESKQSSPDSPQVKSPDGKLYAFVRSSKETVAAGNGDVPADVIFIGESSGGAPTALFKKAGKVQTGQSIGEISFGGIYDLNFSNDSKELYFLNAAYAVSAAVLAADLKTRKIRYVTDGNSLEFARNGQWKGNLIVERHKYNDNGAYDVKCVMSTSGKELKELKDSRQK